MSRVKKSDVGAPEVEGASAVNPLDVVVADSKRVRIAPIEGQVPSREHAHSSPTVLGTQLDA